MHTRPDAPLLLHAPLPAMDRPRKPRSNGGPEGPWWRQPWGR